MKMKTLRILSLIATFLVVACTPEPDFIESVTTEGKTIESIKVTAPDFEGAENITRTAVEITNDGASFNWAANDTIGIFPTTGYQVAFPMASGAGSQTAEFNGGGWGLKSNSQYAAYYPFEYNNRNRKHVAITYVGQVQKGNDNTQHIGLFDYMAASATTPTEGSVSFNFQHLGALVQWKIKIPEAGNFTSLTLETKEHTFIRNGKLDLSKSQPIIESSDKSTSVSMELDQVSTTAGDQEIIVYMMMAPVDLSGKEFTLSVTNDQGKVAEASITGQKFEAGKAYSLSATLSAFQEAVLQIADRKGKAIGMDGGTLTLEYLSNVDCQYIVSDNAKDWIIAPSGRAVTERSVNFQIEANANDTNRRGTVTIKSLKSNLAIEYTILQGGTNTYAITEEGGNLPIGILSSPDAPTSTQHGITALIDNNLDTYFEVAKNACSIIWESPYQVAINRFDIAINAGVYGAKNVSIQISNDGKTWNGLGWGVIYGQSGSNSLVQNEMAARSQYYKLVIEANQGGSSTRISEFGLSEDMAADKPITTLDELLKRGDSFSNSSNTPMGNHYENKHVTTEADRAWLATASNEPNLLPSAPGYTHRKYDVNLYPYGTPLPADVNQHGVGDCSALAVFAEMAYQFPEFIQSIITDHNDGTYTVAMYDPQGKPVDVTIQSTFLGDDNGIGGSSGKDGKANWATILEKAIMKWNYIYEVNPDINGIGSEHVAPLFTGQGNSFAISPGSLLPEQLEQAVKIALENHMIVIGGFTTGGLTVNGGPQTVNMHAFSFMLSNEPDAMFAMRNPWGNSPSGTNTDDGILNIVNDGIIPPIIDLRIIYPGAAEKYVVKELKPYIPPKY